VFIVFTAFAPRPSGTPMPTLVVSPLRPTATTTSWTSQSGWC